MSQARINTTDVNNVLAQVNKKSTLQFYAFMESGRARIAYSVGEYGGRSTVFSGTAWECFTFADGMLMGVQL